MEKILTLFTSEDRDEIRGALKELIIEQVKNDLENSTYYLVNPDEVQEMVQEVVEEAKEEVKEVYKGVLMKQMEEKLKL